MFLFTDSQIKDEAFVEDINNMLNAGEVPNMFPSDEKMQVCLAGWGFTGGRNSLVACSARSTGVILPALPVCVLHASCQALFVLPVCCLFCLQILESVRPAAAKLGLESPLQLWGYFASTCKRNLHIVLCMSPIGDACRYE